MTRGEGHAAVLHKAQHGHQDTWMVCYQADEVMP